MVRRTAVLGGLVAVLLVGACARTPLRTVATLDTSVPVGRIEDQHFTGQRVPLELSAQGTPWRLTTEYPQFLLEQGYSEAGLRASQLFAFNPETRSSLQISFSPAGPYDTFSQQSIEWLTGIVSGGMRAELDAEYGAGNYELFQGHPEPYRLQGVAYAARNFTAYETARERRENGWIYGFAEPFQIFILYQLNGKDPSDRRDLEKILDTFRYVERTW